MTRHEKTREVFARSPLGALDEDKLQTLVAAGTTVTVRKNTHLFRKGAKSPGISFVVEGALKLWNSTPSGDVVVVDFLFQGDVAGELTTLGSKPSHVTATALVTTQVFQIPQDKMLELFDEDPTLALMIASASAHKLYRAYQYIEDSRANLSARLASALIRLSIEVGSTTDEGILLDIGASQVDLANYIGISRSNVSRAFSDLAQQGIIRREGRRLLIRDLAALKRLSQRQKPQQA